ncbi:MAG: dihydrofolate synthase / folylpolyglutamate synthase [Clostridiales bacterium]|nr:dihydrofolate synthase / folylpolyglutamate synthase [Clostridiales bacterium]
MTDEQAVAWLDGRERLGTDKQAQAIKLLATRLGNPQDGLRFVHITGTNGKGSTAAMIASVLNEAGIRAGLFVSPHVEAFAERITVAGEALPQGVLGEITAKVKAVSDELEEEGIYATEFQLITVVAFLCFAQLGCQLVCLEVGIGGALDSTNIVTTTDVACFTHIGLDHTEILGDTVEKITEDKCGILKPGCIAVSYPLQRPSVAAIIARRCKEMAVPLRLPQARDIYLLRETMVENYVNYGGYEVRLKLHGSHQAANCAVAIEAVLALCDKGWDISDEAIIAGLEKATLPARTEVLQTSPLILLDGGHNQDSAEALAALLKATHTPPLTGVMGILEDKDRDKVLKAWQGCFDQVYTITPPHTPRALDADTLAMEAAQYFDRVEACASLELALQKAQARGKGFCVCGSFYLAGAARLFLTEQSAETQGK